jgi:hypothetical protein
VVAVRRGPTRTARVYYFRWALKNAVVRIQEYSAA